MKLSAEGKIRLAVKLAFIAGAGTVAGGAFAQDSTQLQGVQVTGSRIKQPNLTSSSSMVVISDKELQLEGTVNVSTLLNNLPQTFAGFGTTDSNGSTGTSTVDLRGLGPQETLVLIDGKRLMPGDPLQTPPSADLNFIPAALVDRIDILSGGASAVYGSDAVAGVVNFVMKKDFQGFRLDAQASRTDHSDGTTYNPTLIWGNNFSGGKGNVTLYAGFQKMDAITEDRRPFSRVAYATSKDGKTHYAYGSGTIQEGRLISYNRAYAGSYNKKFGGSDYVAPLPGSATGEAFPKTSAQSFNFAPYNYLQRPDTRYNLGGFAHDKINDHLDIYGSAMFMDDHTVAQVAPSGVFGTPVTIQCDNPMLTAGEVNQFCNDPNASNAAYNAANPGLPAYGTPNPGPAGTKAPGPQTTDTFALFRRTPEVGARDDDFRHDQFRIQVGARGDITKAIGYDFSAQHSEVIYQHQYLGYTNTNNVINALNVVNTGTTANPVLTCQSVVDGSDPNCVPLNVFQQNSITPGAAKYITGVGESVANQVEQVVTTSVNADLGEYGVTSPFAKSGLGLAGGFEYRTESLDYRPDSNIASGNLGGLGGPSPAVAGAFNVHEEFLEAQMPLLENQVGAKLLQADAAYRLSKYSIAGEAHNYKGGLKYAPTQDALFRGSFQRATRAPAVNELFSPVAFGLVGGADPCAAVNLYKPVSSTDPTLTSTLVDGAPTAAQCANSGVTASQYGKPGSNPGNIKDCSAGQCNIEGGGNLALKNELSITRSLGVVLTPRMVKNFSVSFDYFDITVRNAIGVVPFNTILNECLATDNPFYCGSIHRGPLGSLGGQASTDGNYVNQQTVNTGLERTKGFDTQLDYRIRLRELGLGNNGQFVFSYSATYLTNFSFESSPLTGVYECVGRFGTTCGTPNPRYRHKLRVTWDTPIGLQISGLWRYFGGVKLDSNTNDPHLTNNSFDAADSHIAAKQYFDLSSAYALPIKQVNLTLRAGISNLFGQSPPILNQTIAAPPFGNGNTFPNVYDSLGRVIFVGMTMDL